MKIPVPPPTKDERPHMRVLIADDTPEVLHDLHQLLELTGLFDIVAEAGNGREAIRLAGELCPEVVVLDLEMPGLDGYAATRQIKTQQPSPRVVILSVHADPSDQELAREAGADDFVVKGARYETLINAILGKGGESDSINSEKGNGR